MLLALLLLLGLSACKLSSLTELLYFNRDKYVFTDDKEETRITFMCKTGDSREGSAKRAEQSNLEYLDGYKTIMDELSQNFKPLFELDDKELFKKKYMKVMLNMQNRIEKLQANIEKEHACMLIDLEDLNQDDTKG